MKNPTEIVSGSRHVVWVDDFRVEGLRNRLRTRIIKIRFLKTNGEERDMRATLLQQYLPPSPLKENKEVADPTALACWDIDKKAWRSFRVDSIIQIEDELPNNKQIVYVRKGH